jgi:DNA polymerase I-like protein with 3'-5' exonuclease and polymerase domains
MVGQGYIAPELPKGLDFICSVYTKEPYYKDDGKKWFKVGGSDYNTFWAYNAKDSAVCLEAFPKIYADLRRLGNEKAYHDKIKLIEPLLYMSEHGLLTDVAGLRKASEEAEVELKQLTIELHKIAGYELNPSSPKQLANHFYSIRGYRPYTNRKTGNISTDESALTRLANKGSAEAKILLKTRKLEKLKGTYYDVRIDPDSRFRCAYNPVGTKGGRISSSESIFDTGGNFQNIPNSVRRYLLADPGYILYAPDLSQAENRVVAYIAPDLNMIRAFEEGIDIHRQTASLIFNKPMDQISSDEDVEADPSCASSIGGGLFSERFWGKKGNHAFNYGEGYRLFALINEIPESEAKFIRERYLAVYPGVTQYHSWVQEQLRVSRTLTDCFGNNRRFLDRW